MFLLGSKYNRNSSKVILQFLNKDGELVIIPDWTGHKPYFFTMDNSLPGDSNIVEVSHEIKYDRMKREYVKLRKVVMSNPLAVGGRDGLANKLNESYEHNIKFHWLYLYDHDLIPGIDYNLNGTVEGGLAGGELIPNITPVSDNYLENLVGQPIPEIPLCSVDIEVDTKKYIPNPDFPDKPISCICIINPVNKIIYLNRPDIININGAVIRYYTDELSMIRDAMSEIMKWPVVLTYNGFRFDFSYLYNRALNLGMVKEELKLEKHTYGIGPEYPVHLDLLLYFSNPTIQNYVYGAAYKFHGLGDISKALLNKEKFERRETADMSAQELAEYCLNDAQLLIDLAKRNNNELLKILITLSRITKVPVEDLCIWGTNKWIYSMFINEHKKRGCLIPNKKQLGEHKAVTTSIIKGKKFRGATVLKPIKGIHFDVTMLDCASLYSTIISRFNLSYETVNCPHQNCKTNIIPETPYWYCSKDKGIIASILSDLRNLRISKIKPKAKADPYWRGIDQAIKTVLNACWGVISSEAFPLYFLPMGESILSLERHIMNQLIAKCQDLSLKVFMGDTDGLVTPTSPKISDLIEYGRDLRVDLEVDKEFKWLALTDRKKNYLGETREGNIIIKGLQGRKIHTPKLITMIFNSIIDILKTMKDRSDIDRIRPLIKDLVSGGLNKIINKEYNLEDYEFKMVIKQNEYKTEAVDSRTGTVRKVQPPMHVRAAREAGIDAKPGTVIHFVKTIEGPKLTYYADKDRIDVEAYIDNYQSSLEQILDALNFDFYDMINLEALESYET